MAQNKKTEALEDLELPDVTGKQLEFIYGIKAGLSASAAYRSAYDCSNMSDQSIWVAASRLKSSPNVSLWLSAIKKEQITAANYTHDQFLQELEELKAIAVQSGNIGAAVNALVNKGKSAGHMVEKREITHIKADSDEFKQAMDALKQAGLDMGDLEAMQGTKH